MSLLAGLAPQGVFTHFEKITRIPHGSGDEKALSDYIVAWAKEHDVWVYQDAVYNIVLKQAGTKGYEQAAPVLLQGHLDMVCEKTAESTHNFLTDPIPMQIQGDWVCTRGTTLGADDGIGVAYILALLESDDIPHPPLEVLLTVDEEVGMLGAQQFDEALFTAKRMINLDEEQDGQLTVSCAGGSRAEVVLPLIRVQPPEGLVYTQVDIHGLLGGHSGGEIHKERANAGRLLGRLLHAVNARTKLALVTLEGGRKENIILHQMTAVIGVPREFDLVGAAEEMQRTFRSEYRTNDPDITLTLTPVTPVDPQIIEHPDVVTAALCLLPYGVLGMSHIVENLVETSCNMGVIRDLGDRLQCTLALRSSVASRRAFLKVQIEQIAAGLGAAVSHYSDYPAWEYTPVSPIRQLCMDCFEARYGCPMKVSAIHAGLECGLMTEKMPELDIVALGPDIENAHMPAERLSISSTGRVWQLLLDVLREMKD